MPEHWYVKTPNVFLRGAKRVSFQIDLGMISSGLASANVNNDHIYNDPDHVVLIRTKVGTPQAEALYAALGKTNFCHITSLSIRIEDGIGHSVIQDVNALLKAWAVVENIKRMELHNARSNNGNILELDMASMRKSCKSLEHFVIFNTSSRPRPQRRPCGMPSNRRI